MRLGCAVRIDVGRGRAELERDRAEIARQRSLGTPDLAVMGGVRHLADGSGTGFWFGVEAPLPLADRNRGGVRASEYRLARTREASKGSRVAVSTDLALAYEDLAAAHDEIRTLDTEVLPEAEGALETAAAAYGRGLFRLTDILDIRRRLFELRGRRIDALRRYYAARARIERLTGTALSG